MKKIIITLTLLLGVIVVQGQENAITEYYSDYQEREDVTKIAITGKVFELMAYVETDNPEDEEFKEFLSSINSFQMIIGEDNEYDIKEYRSALRRVEKDYEELMAIEDKDGTFSFRIDEKNGVVREFLMIGLADNNLIIFSLTGDMDLAQLSRIGSKVQTEGFSYLEKLEENASESVKVYPNPVQSGKPLNVQVPESYIGGTVTIFDMQGKSVANYAMGLKKQRIELKGLKVGQYIIEFRKDGVSQSRKLEVN